MDEPRHDFLAGARRAGDQHGRVRRGDLRRLAQHAAPFDTLADDAQVGARRQLIDPSLRVRVGPLRTRVIGLVRRSSECPALCPESEVVRDPPG